MKLKKQFSGVLATTAVLLCSALSPFASASAATTNILLGDANGDGVVNIADAACISQYLGGGYTTNAKNFTAMDVNEDGVINLTDQYMLQYLEANKSAPTKAGTTVKKECYTLPQNTPLQYRRHDCSDSNLKSYKTYTIPVANAKTSSDFPVAYASSFNTNDHENVACVEILSNGERVGSGFIISNDTIATAAHCIYNDTLNNFKRDVTVRVNTNEVVNGQVKEVFYTASAEYLHMPSKYINGNDFDVNYDYGLIRVGDFKDENGKTVNVRNYSVNLGIMTDEFINAQEKSLTSVGYSVYNQNHNRYQSTGKISSSDVSSTEFAYRYCIGAKSIDRKSGGMTYFDSGYVNPGINYTISTRSIVGINTSEYDDSKSYGIRITPNIIRFLNMSSLFEED